MCSIHRLRSLCARGGPCRPVWFGGAAAFELVDSLVLTLTCSQRSAALYELAYETDKF